MEKGTFRMKHLLLTLLMFTVSYVVMAQRTINGKIIGGDKQPLAGATITNKQTKAQTVSDANGSFSIIASDNDVLEVSNVGFANKEIRAADASLPVELAIAQTALNEVVVTATGIKKEAKRLGYAVQTIDASGLTKAREANPVNALKGQVAGLSVNVNSEIARQADAIIRGTDRPIFVVDGVATTSETYNVNPDDIETITVLKGPNAAALYGFQGQGGAIIISTKKGTKDQRGVVVNFNSSTQFNKGFIALPRYQDEYGGGENGKYAYGGGGSSPLNYFGNGVVGTGLYDYDYDIWGPQFRGQLLPQFDGEYDPTQTYTTTYADGSTYTGHVKPTPYLARGKDNLKKFLQTGLISTNSLSVASSSEKTDLRVSFGNTYQRGIVPNTQLNNGNVNINLTQRFNKKLSASVYFNYARQSTPNISDVDYGPNSIIYNMILWGGADWSIDDMRDYWEPGKVGIQQKYVEHYQYNNPWFMSYEWLRGHYQNNEYGYLSLNYKLNDKIDFQFRPSLSAYDMVNTEKFPYSGATYGRDDRHMGDYREDRRAFFEHNEELQARFHQNSIFGFLDVQALAGGNIRNLDFKADFTTTDYLNIPGIYAFSNSLNPIRGSSFHSNLLVLSAYYSVDLGYKSYITANITGRWDKSSSMPLNTNTYYYPSYNVATVISDYVKLPEVISFLKLRGSYAQSKAGGTTDRYSLGNGYSGFAWSSPYGGPAYQFTQTYGLSAPYTSQVSAGFTNQLIDPTIYTSDRKATEFGIDLRFLKNRIGLDVTHFRYINTGIVGKGISPTTGYSSILTNGDKYSNDGWEATINAKPIVNPDGFGWNIIANYSTYVRKWINIANPNNWVKNGSRVDLNYGNAYVKTPDGQLVVDPSSGIYIKFSDLGSPAQRIFGHSDPDWSWAVLNTLSYKNLSLHFQFDGIVGGVLNDYVRQKSLQGGRHVETTLGALGAARPSDEAGVPAYTAEGVTYPVGTKLELDPVTGEITNYNDIKFSPNTVKSFVQGYVYRASQASELTTISKTYTKLREVTISYQLPASVLGKTFIRSASISVVGRNLLYFFPSRYKDLDVDQYTTGDGGSGLQTPTMRNYGFNVNLTF